MQRSFPLPTNLLQERFFRWIDRRHPPARRHQLHRKNLYIFPTLTGFAYLVLVVIIWLLGTNYQNNLILALAYLQISVFVLTILNTYNNLAGLRVEFIGAEDGFVGEKIAFRFVFETNNRRGAHYVTAHWLDNPATILDFEARASHQETVFATATQRGWLRPQRLLLKSTFPMGLLRCWTWLNFDAAAVIYPAPVACDLPPGVAASEPEDGQATLRLSGDEFAGFRAYRPGDSPKQIAWKQYARDRGLLSKEYAAPVTNQTWLQWSDFFRGDQELALSQMCYWVERFGADHRAFGVKLPAAEFAPDFAPGHRETVLRALGLQGMDP